MPGIDTRTITGGHRRPRGQPSIDTGLRPTQPSGETIDAAAVWRRCVPQSAAEEQRFVDNFKRLGLGRLFGGAEDVEIGKVDLSLVCPFTKKRLKVPVRDASCLHTECFELDAFFTAAERTRSRRDPHVECPFPNCRAKPRASSLVVDWWQYHLLNSSEFAGASKVTVFPTGGAQLSDAKQNDVIEVDALTQLTPIRDSLPPYSEPKVKEEFTSPRSVSPPSTVPPIAVAWNDEESFIELRQSGEVNQWHFLGSPVCPRCGTELTPHTTSPDSDAVAVCCNETVRICTAPRRFVESGSAADSSPQFVVFQIPEERTVLVFIEPSCLALMSVIDLAGVSDALCRSGIFTPIGPGGWLTQELLTRGETGYVVAVLRDGISGKYSSSSAVVPSQQRTPPGATRGGLPTSRDRGVVPRRFAGISR